MKPGTFAPLSAALSLLLPGLGQAFRGDLVRGVALHLVDLSSALGLWWTGFLSSLGLPGLVLSLLALAAVRTLVALDAARRALALGKGPARSRWAAVGLLAALAFLADPLAIRWAVVEGPARVWAYRISTSSMAPAVLPGETVLAGLRPYRDSPLRRGEVVVFGAPEGFGDPGSRLALKRIVGLEGETVEIRDGRLLVNGRIEPSPWWGRVPEGSWPMAGPVRVPEGAVFLVGDHLEGSVDSRRYGPVSREALVARGLYVLVSPEARRIGLSLLPGR